MEVGTVKWFNNAKGWGFLQREDGSDVFVHYSNIEGDGYRVLRQGQRVTFELQAGPRGAFAKQVHFLDADESGEVVTTDLRAVG